MLFCCCSITETVTVVKMHEQVGNTSFRFWNLGKALQKDVNASCAGTQFSASLSLHDLSEPHKTTKQHLWEWCWGCCHGYCSPAAASRAGCNGHRSNPSSGPGSSWGWRSGCTSCQSWWGFQSCWTAPTGNHIRGRYVTTAADVLSLQQEQVWSWTTRGRYRLVSDLLWESAGLDGWELLVIEVCKHTAQDGVMLKQAVQKCLKRLHPGCRNTWTGKCGVRHGHSNKTERQSAQPDNIWKCLLADTVSAYSVLQPREGSLPMWAGSLTACTGFRGTFSSPNQRWVCSLLCQ